MGRRSNKQCSTCKWCLGTCVIGAIGVGLGLYFGLITKEDLSNVVERIRDTFQDILESDPFSGRGGGGTNANETSGIAWPSNGKGGLQLELVNALDDRWVPFFDKAVADWDSGDPNALVLSTSRTSPDSLCTEIDGKMKVCNGDYGNEGWRGINELVFNSKTQKILHSVAKMNEFYIDDKASDNERQYTMCHEIGHGFGLMHTDENFRNTPLGDCLDYTNNLEPNLLPGLINYQKLAVMYGTVEGGKGGRQYVRKLALLRGHERLEQSLEINEGSSTSTMPAWVKERFQEKKLSLVLGRSNDAAASSHHAGNNHSSTDWVLLHKHDLGEIHQVDLGGGYYGQVRALLV